jgi:hypothetical protein
VVEDKAVKLHAIASLKVIVNSDNHNNPEIVDNNSNGTANGQLVSERLSSQQTTITTVGSVTDYSGGAAAEQQVNVISHTVTLGNDCSDANGSALPVTDDQNSQEAGVSVEVKSVLIKV